MPAAPVWVPNMTGVEALVRFSTRRPWLVLAISLLLTALGLGYSIARFEINTDTARLISSKVDWRRAETALDRAFPGRVDLVVAVVEALTPEQADDAAARLAAGLRARPDRFRMAEQPDGGPFFARNGLLFLAPEDLGRTLAGLDRQKELLSLFAGDQSLRGFATLARAGLIGIRAGAVGADEIAPFLDRFSDVFDQVLAGRTARLSWQGLLGSGGSARRIVLAQPIVDYGALQPGEAATRTLRETAVSIGLTPENGVSVRLTGPVPLADEEFATLAENMALNASLTLLAVVAILFLALRSWRLIATVLITLMAGLVTTCGLGLLLVGRFNLISVAFFALFIGLGVDFGIQFAVRYRAERHGQGDLKPAINAAARGVGFSLTLAALALIAGFLSFLPTDFVGVSELGLIAGLGMAIACLASFTTLPALITLMAPGAEAKPVETPLLANIDRWIERNRVLVLGATALIVLAGVPSLLKVRFDSDPMNLRNARTESVSTFLDLAADPQTSPTTLDVLLPSLDAARVMSERLSTLPEVERVVGLDSFVPEEQEAKLALIRKARDDIAPTLANADRQPPPSDAEDVAALRRAATELELAPGDRASLGGRASKRLSDALKALAVASPDRRAAATIAITTEFGHTLDALRTALTAEPVTRDTLPATLRADWVAQNGWTRVEVTPKAANGGRLAAEAFVAAVRQIAPNATGAPVTVIESGQTIVWSFIEAGIFSLAAITAILWVAMRRLVDVLLALGPLVLAGIMTLEAAHLMGLDLNLANIIALPLMFGVGVAFHIYYLIAWRSGEVDLLASSLTRAIFFSALTTGTAFGSLWSSSHPGTASMGELLTISLVFTLLAAFVVVPAALGPPRARQTPAQAP